jgi:hypothetical protein
MPLLKAIKIYNGRIAQLKRPIGNNQQGRASDINPIVDWVNQRSDVNTTANAVTTSAFAGSPGTATATINAVSGTITTTAIAPITTGTTNTITVTNSYCTANSTVLCQISDATLGTGAAFIQSVIPATGSFSIKLYNIVGLTGTPTLKIKFIIL